MIGDLLRWCFSKIDGLYINLFGRKLIHYSAFINRNSIKYNEEDKLWNEDIEDAVVYQGKPTVLRGIYTIPMSDNTGLFGIDSPNEIQIILNHSKPFRLLGKLFKIPVCGDLIIDQSKDKWLIIARNMEDSMWRGNRLIITCRRHQASVYTKGKEIEHAKA